MQSHVLTVRTSAYATENWYLLAGGNYLVGYDRLSRACVGFFGREGFQPPGNKPISFQGPVSLSLYRPTLMIAGSKTYLFDLPDRRMTTLFDAGNGIAYAIEQFGRAAGASGRIGLALDKEIRVFDGEGRPLLAIPYPHDPKRWGYVSLTTNKALDRIYVESQKSEGASALNGDTAALPVFMDEYNAGGNLLHTYSIPGAGVPPTRVRWVDRVVESSAPLGPMLVDGICSRFAAYETPFADAWQHFLCALAVIALVLAAITFLWARKTGFSNGAALRWAAFSFVFGPAGLLTFRLATDWPVRLRCPSCGKKRAIEREQCMHCHQPWTLPEGNGTEILDGAVVHEL
jgi:hypothetical protein